MQTLDGILFCFFPGISRSKERERKENGEFLQSTPYVLLIFIIQTLHVNPSKRSNLYFHPFFKTFFSFIPCKNVFKKNINKLIFSDKTRKNIRTQLCAAPREKTFLLI